VIVVQDSAGYHADFQLEKMNAETVIAVLTPLVSPDAGALREGYEYQSVFA
jgi:hypothetical protein